jgi:integrase
MESRLTAKGVGATTGIFRPLGVRQPPGEASRLSSPDVDLRLLDRLAAKSEVASLTWAQVDLNEGRIELPKGTTKNGERRRIYVTPELRPS